ncbi:MAG: hypothetical protein ACLFR0_02575 [Alphaproteobacteria bacterium]
MNLFHKQTLMLTSSALIFAGEALAETGENLYEDIGNVDPHGVVGDAAKKGGGGLPQLDPTWFASQIFWLVLLFVGLYFIFSRNILPSISNTLENRHEHIQGDLDTAQRLKEEAEAVHNSYEKSLEEARAKASALYRDVEDDIQAKADKQQEELRARLQKETELSEARIAKTKASAMKDMDEIVAEIAREAAQKIVGISTDQDSAKGVVKDLTSKRKAA